MYIVKKEGMNTVLLGVERTENRLVLFVTNKNIFQDMETFIFYTSTGRNSIDSINSLTARLTLSHL